MNLRNSLLTGIAALAFGLMTPVAIAQTTDTNGQTTPTGSNPTGGDQMNSGTDTDMAAKHKRHHKKHHTSAMNSSPSEEATTEQLNRQQLTQAGAGTAAGGGNENAATYNSAPAAGSPSMGTGLQPGQPAADPNTSGTYRSPSGTTGSSNSASDSPDSSGGNSGNSNNQPAQTTPPPQ